MKPTSLGRICLGKNVYGSLSEIVKGHRDWDALEYTDTTGSKEKKVTKALSFYKMETNEVSERYIPPCFVNSFEAYDGEINLALDENLISNEYVVKLCLDYEVKKENKVVKKELIVALNQELYFVKFVINPKEDDVGPEVISRRSFMRLVNEIFDFGSELLDFNFDDIPQLDGEELSLTSSSTGRHLTQEEAAKEALAHRISQKFALLEEDKVQLDGMIVKEEEEAINKVKGEALKEKDDLGAFIFPIRLEGKYNKNALADTGSYINTTPYRSYEQLGREEIKKVDRGITMINHTQAEAMGILTNVLNQVGVTTIIAKFLILDIPIVRDAFDVLRTAKSDSDGDGEEEYEIKRNKFGAPMYVWKKAVSFLGSLPLPLQHVNWKHDYMGCYTNEEEAKGQWRTEIRVIDPYGNIYVQTFTTKKTDQKLSKYHKFSDIMSPNVTQPVY
nr:hypothetical protein [Tanacetum cinerariifolium]